MNNMIKKEYTNEDICLKTKTGSKLFCFGAGKALINTLEKNRKNELEKYITSIIDNDLEKIGKNIVFNNIAIQVIDIDRLVEIISKDDIILITSSYHKQIIEQLGQYDVFNNIEYCIYSVTNALQHDYEREKKYIPRRLGIYDEIKIPKIIHYCWFGRNPIPNQYKKWMESWKRYCPDYEIIEWNEDNYDIRQNEYISQAYDCKKWAFVSDFARVDVVERYGGVYLDTDAELVRNMDELLKNDLFCGFESEGWINFGLGFGAIKHHSIVKKLRDDYVERKFVLVDGSLNMKTCTQYQTELLLGHGLQLNGEFQLIDGVTVLPEIVLSGMSYESKKIIKDLSRTYSIHHYAGSWLDK